MYILLVEDHQSTCTVLERILSGWGHEVVAVQDLRTSLRLLSTERFDVIISDIALPDGSGYALMSEARKFGNPGIAIAISAYPYPADAYEPAVTGFDYHLNKPCDPEQLRYLLEEKAWPVRDLPGVGVRNNSARIANAEQVEHSRLRPELSQRRRKRG